MKRYIIAVLLALVLLLPFQSFASVTDEPPEVEASDVAEESGTVEIEIPESFEALFESQPEPESVEQESRYNEPIEPDRVETDNTPNIEPFASGVIVGELIDMLQEPLENDGYTAESWQRYENAVAAAWEVIGNFMAYTNDEVREIINELQAATYGLEYPAGEVPSGEYPALDSEFLVALIVSIGVACGAVFGMAFVSKWAVGI